MFLASLADADYRPSSSHCGSHFQHINFDCTQQKLTLAILKELKRNGTPKAKKHMGNLISKRTRHYIKRKEFDYLSVIGLLKYPVRNRLTLLKEMQKHSGQNSFYTEIALLKIRGINQISK